MINKFYFKHKVFEFKDYNYNSSSNLYTIIVGKNGTGKSTLLSNIVREFLRNKEIEFYKDSELGFHYHNHKGRLERDSEPNMVITVSTSPFDKFPILRRSSEIENYSYLGLRDLISTNFSLSYMSKIIASLVNSIFKKPSQIKDIIQVLNYLGYTDTINAHFNLSLSHKYFEDFLHTTDKEDFILNYRTIPLRFNRKFFLLDNGKVDESKLYHLTYLAEEILNKNIRLRCNLIIDRSGIKVDNGFEYLNDNNILFLIQSGILKLRDVQLMSQKSFKPFSIRDASSGEQSVILGILGIASKIRDYSLICIDEPEVCLHPEWQEKYIQILMSTFQTYNHCHFIIATHSPQIVSRLSSYNCYILNMESGKVKDATNYINNSIDFQLANIFDSPGFKNEYLSRIAFNIFSKVSRNKSFDSDDIEKYNLIEHLSGNMDDDDPVKNLFIAIKELYKLYV